MGKGNPTFGVVGSEPPTIVGHPGVDRHGE